MATVAILSDEKIEDKHCRSLKTQTRLPLGSLDREQMIVTFAPLVRQVVGRLLVTLPQALDREDLLGYGTIGLIEAVDRYNPEHGASFETFAADRIRGSVLDALRAADWIPRTSRKRAKDIQKTFLALEQDLGRPPTEEEVATTLNLTLTQLHRAMADAVASIVSLERPLRAQDGEEGVATLLDYIADETVAISQDLEQRELRQSVVDALRRLSDRERLVLSLYYERSLTLREIGEVMDICESRVWQLHARAILRIRAYIDDTLGGALTALRPGSRSLRSRSIPTGGTKSPASRPGSPEAASPGGRLPRFGDPNKGKRRVQSTVG